MEGEGEGGAVEGEVEGGGKGRRSEVRGRGRGKGAKSLIARPHTGCSNHFPVLSTFGQKKKSGGAHTLFAAT